MQSDNVKTPTDVDLERLLFHTSRTFALTIPLLPEPARTDVMLAYLVFRIADTLEDAENLSPQARLVALMEFDHVLQSADEKDADRFARHWSDRSPSTNAWYVQLLRHVADVMAAIKNRDSAIADIILLHARRSTNGMAHFATKSIRAGQLNIRSMEQLQQYCYVVAGIVGEMLTDIFACRLELNQKPAALGLHAKTFGEGLQLVNILKDRDEDRVNGRVFIPRSASGADLFRLAREDLQQAELYVQSLRDMRAPAGYIAFTNLPLQLARATLRKVEVEGSGAKISRGQVSEILAAVLSDARASGSDGDQLAERPAIVAESQTTPLTSDNKQLYSSDRTACR